MNLCANSNLVQMLLILAHCIFCADGKTLVFKTVKIDSGLWNGHIYRFKKLSRLVHVQCLRVYLIFSQNDQYFFNIYLVIYLALRCV